MTITSLTSFFSYSFGFAAYLCLLLLLFFNRKRIKQHSKIFVSLTITMIVWNIVLALQSSPFDFSLSLIATFELLRNLAWYLLLLYFSGRLTTERNISITSPLSLGWILGLLGIALITIYTSAFSQVLSPIASHSALVLFILLGSSILGLLLVEQLYRNTRSEFRWHIQYLVISAAAIFAYDFYTFSEMLLFKSISQDIWSARGIISALVIPGLIITMVRNPKKSPDIHLSRTFVFHSSILLITGIYLICMAIVGYAIRESDLQWSGLLQVLFLFSASIILIGLFFSNTLKTKIKHYLNHNFFSHKYDYRDEWFRFSNRLFQQSDESFQSAALAAIAQVVDAQGADLWQLDNDHFYHSAHWRMNLEPAPDEPLLSHLSDCLNEQQGLITLQEFKYYLSQFNGDEAEHWLLEAKNSWLIIPLWLHERLTGFILLRDSISSFKLDQEDRALLNTLAHHSALYLSQAESAIELMETRKFNDLNKMTTFLVHDLKTVLSQLSLMVDNAKVHKENPLFIDDMIKTVEHTTHKMRRLIQQLQSPTKTQNTETIDLVPLINNIMDEFHNAPITLELMNSIETLNIQANTEDTHAIFKHLIQNGLDAIANDGKVKISIKTLNDHAIIEIEDNGKGMSQSFIRQHLFSPFHSTKGVSGMGIGVYQSRELLHKYKGTMQVKSKEGVGSCFTLQLPINSAPSLSS